jgi:hypothetical protein
MTRLEELKANAEAADAACDTALDAAWAVCDAAVDAAETARADAWAAYEAELKKTQKEKQNE